MNIVSYIILGIVQGVGEFLPISSSGHLIIAKYFVKVPEDLVLDVTLHIATLLAVLLYYRKDLLNISNYFLKDIKNILNTKKITFSQESKYVLYIITACIPTFVLGFVFKDFFESFRSIYVVLAMLVIVSFFMLLDVFKLGFKNGQLTYKNAFIIGLMQTLALIPGTSRSGATITTASLLGIKKSDAARFSFLLSIPAILAAFVLELKDVENVNYFFNINLIVAFITAFLSGLLSIKILLKLLNKYGFVPFIIYRLFIAVIVVIFLMYTK